MDKQFELIHKRQEQLMICLSWGPISARFLPLTRGVNAFCPTWEFCPAQRADGHSAELSRVLQPKAAETCPNWLPHSCWQLCLHGAQHGRLSSACDIRERRTTSAYPGSFLSECKTVVKRRLRLARVGIGSGAKAWGGVGVGSHHRGGGSMGIGHFT